MVNVRQKKKKEIMCDIHLDKHDGNAWWNSSHGHGVNLTALYASIGSTELAGHRPAAACLDFVLAETDIVCAARAHALERESTSSLD